MLFKEFNKKIVILHKLLFHFYNKFTLFIHILLLLSCFLNEKHLRNHFQSMQNIKKAVAFDG